MQTLNDVRLGDKLLFPGDMVDVVSVVKKLGTATIDQLGQKYFLTTPCTVNIIAEGVIKETQVLQSGKIYKCVSYVYVDPTSSEAVSTYKWQSITYAESGKLASCTEVSESITQNALADGGGWTTKLTWKDPSDVSNPSDPVKNAIWAYTVVVRKLGKIRPKTVYDGDIVGFSSVRDQYYSKKSKTGFVDFIPESNYSYNIFAVTRYGVATGRDDGGGSEVDWIALRKLIWAGQSGLSLGDLIPVTHDQYGTIMLQVVDMRTGDKSLPDYGVNPDNPSNRSVVFMSYTTLPRVGYDAPESEIDYAGVLHPGDSPTETEHKCSVSGHCWWGYSNLRQWLNQDEWVRTQDTEIDPNKTYGTYDSATKTYTPVVNPVKEELANYYEFAYSKTTDTSYVTSKCYYIKSTTESGEDKYTPVVTPPYPEKVNPKAEGYYEASWKWRPINTGPGGDNRWDLPPNGKTPTSTDAGYTYGGKNLPGFLVGFSRNFCKVIAEVKNKTFIDNLCIQPAVSGSKLFPTDDKVFIPSYQEMWGVEPPGIEGNSTYKDSEGNQLREGSHFPFYNKKIPIPDMSLANRSMIKRDMENGLSGYFLRSIGTEKSSETGAYSVHCASQLWTTSCRLSITPPELGEDVMETRKCSMTVTESKERSVFGNKVAPGIAWCVVIG